MGKIKVTETGTTIEVGDDDKVSIQIPGGGNVTIEAEDSSVKKIQIEFKGDDHADTAIINLSTFAQNDLHIDIKQYDPTDHIQLQGAYDFYVDPDEPDEFTFKYIGSDGNEYTGFVHAKDGGEKNFLTDPPPIIICFTPGTMITTPRGPVAIEDLRVGDLVITADNGLQAVRWIGCKRMSGARLQAYPELRPIRIRKGAFGQNLPDQDMWVSPQHRMLVKAEQTILGYGESEVLAPAKGLLNDFSVTVDYGISTTQYIHILFDRHEVIFANGTPSESFHPGQHALSSVEATARDEMFEIFPELAQDPTLYGPSARVGLRVRETQSLCKQGVWGLQTDVSASRRKKPRRRYF